MEFDELRQRQKKAKTEPNTTEYSFQRNTLPRNYQRNKIQTTPTSFLAALRT